MPGTGQNAVQRTTVLVDVESFGVPIRALSRQPGTRAGVCRVAAEALQADGVLWDACRPEDRGGGAFVLVPPECPKGQGVPVLAVRWCGTTGHDAARARLRSTVRAQEVGFDEHDGMSTTLTTAFRLPDAARQKKLPANTRSALAMIVSRPVFGEVLRHSMTPDSTAFHRVDMAVKEVRDTAWIALPTRRPQRVRPQGKHHQRCAQAGRHHLRLPRLRPTASRLRLRYRSAAGKPSMSDACPRHTASELDPARPGFFVRLKGRGRDGGCRQCR
jgi:hypothetical protein